MPALHNDTNKVKTLNLLSFRYFSYYPEKGLYYGEQGRALAVRLHWKQGEAKAYNSIGANYWAKIDFVKAQDFYLKVLKINEQLSDKKEIARNLHNIADIYAVEYNYPTGHVGYLNVGTSSPPLLAGADARHSENN